MTTVVLGWDGLDAQLVDEFGLGQLFGDEWSRIKTFANEIIGEPHTREVWPSIITGVSPNEHGIYAVEEGDGIKWSNPAIEAASDIAQYCLPHGVRTRIGRRLRSQGAEVEKFSADYYREYNLPTVFDGRRSLPIAVPNYWTERDDRHDYLFDRGAHLSQWLDRGSEGWQPVDREAQARVEQEMVAEATRKLGAVQAAIQREYDLVFAWFGIVDTAGHVEPVSDGPIQRRAYELAAGWTEVLRRQLAPDDTLVCLSDHGLRDGHHTMDATVASNSKDVVGSITSVFDVRAALGRVTAARDPVGTPPLQDRHTHESGGEADTASIVRQNLEQLGYV